MVYWKCVCDCGKDFVACGGNIRSHKTLSCGCLKGYRKEPGRCGLTNIYSCYKGNARTRKLAFELSKEQFKDIAQQACHYCRRPPTHSGISRHPKSTEAGVEHSRFIYNGIDRKDSKQGYLLTNCLPCCRICNRAKSDMTYDEFIDYLRYLTANWKVPTNV